jgi:hypothetical protein
VFNLLMRCCSMCRQQRSLVYCHYGSGFRGQHQEHGEATAPHTHAARTQLESSRSSANAPSQHRRIKQRQHAQSAAHMAPADGPRRDVEGGEESEKPARAKNNASCHLHCTAPLCPALRDRAVGVEGTASHQDLQATVTSTAPAPIRLAANLQQVQLAGIYLYSCSSSGASLTTHVCTQHASTTRRTARTGDGDDEIDTRPACSLRIGSTSQPCVCVCPAVGTRTRGCPCAPPETRRGCRCQRAVAAAGRGDSVLRIHGAARDKAGFVFSGAAGCATAYTSAR